MHTVVGRRQAFILVCIGGQDRDLKESHRHQLDLRLLLNCPGSDTEKKDLRSHKLVQEWREPPCSPLVLDRIPLWMRVWMRLREGAQLNCQAMVWSYQLRGKEGFRAEVSGFHQATCERFAHVVSLEYESVKWPPQPLKGQSPWIFFCSKTEMPVGSLHEREGTEWHLYDVRSLSLPPCRSRGEGNVLRSQILFPLTQVSPTAGRQRGKWLAQKARRSGFQGNQMDDTCSLVISS